MARTIELLLAALLVIVFINGYAFATGVNEAIPEEFVLNADKNAEISEEAARANGINQDITGGSSLAVDENTELPASLSRGELYAPYAMHGVTYDEATDRLYLNGEMVKLLYDSELDLLYSVPEGTLCLLAIYENGELIGVVGTTEETVNAAAQKRQTAPEKTGLTPEEMRAELKDLLDREDEIIESGQMTQEEFDDVVQAMEEYIGGSVIGE